jgi:hypothetical protein
VKKIKKQLKVVEVVKWKHVSTKAKNE